MYLVFSYNQFNIPLILIISLLLIGDNGKNNAETLSSGINYNNKNS